MKNISYLLMLLIMLTTACDELEVVPALDDLEEIERYIADSDLGQSFFRKSNIIDDTPYSLSTDSGAMFSDLVDSTTRIINTYIALDVIGASYVQPEQDHGSPYFVKRDAEVTVTDRFYITTTRIFQDDTTVIKNVRKFVRYGYFMKLGDDSQRFSGWQLIGFSSAAELAGGFGPRIQKADNATFSSSTVGLFQYSSIIYDAADTGRSPINHQTTNRYYQLVGIDQPLTRLVNGEQLTVLTNNLLFDQSLVSAQTSSGYIYQPLKSTPVDSSGFDFQTPTNHSPSWNIICFTNLYGLDNDTLNVLPVVQINGEINCAAYRVE